MWIVVFRKDGAPEREVIVVVVDNGGDLAVGIDLDVLWIRLLAFLEVEILGLVGETKLLKNDGNFPKKC